MSRDPKFASIGLGETVRGEPFVKVKLITLRVPPGTPWSVIASACEAISVRLALLETIAEGAPEFKIEWEEPA